MTMEAEIVEGGREEERDVDRDVTSHDSMSSLLEGLSSQWISPHFMPCFSCDTVL
jgi:hypothetical protein